MQQVIIKFVWFANNTLRNFAVSYTNKYAVYLYQPGVVGLFFKHLCHWFIN